MTPKERKEYYRINKDKRLAYQKRYYEVHKEAIKKNLADRKSDDPDWAQKQREYNRKYYLENRAQIKSSRALKSG